MTNKTMYVYTEVSREDHDYNADGCWSNFFSEDSPGGMGSKGKLVTHSLKHPAGNCGFREML